MTATRCAATVYLVERQTDPPRLQPIGTAVVTEDGRTLLITIEESLTLGPNTPVVVRGM